MFDRAALRADFGLAAGHYTQHAKLQANVLERCVDLAKHYIPAHADMLDLGCGPAPLAAMAKTQGLPWRITGADLAYPMCRQAHKRTGISCVAADAQQLPLKARCVDAVFSSLMLQWANDPPQVFSECARVLRPGGNMVLSTFGEHTLQELRNAFTHAGGHARVSHFPVRAQLKQWAHAAGLTVLHAETSCISEHYADMRTLMRALKAIGATNKLSSRKRGLTTPRLFTQAERHYRTQSGDAQGLIATWQIHYLVLRR